jgi:hypothetical protein
MDGHGNLERTPSNVGRTSDEADGVPEQSRHAEQRTFRSAAYTVFIDNNDSMTIPAPAVTDAARFRRLDLTS